MADQEKSGWERLTDPKPGLWRESSLCLLPLVSWCHMMAVSEDIPESQSQMGRGENSLKSKTFLISSILDKGAAQPGE